MISWGDITILIKSENDDHSQWNLDVMSLARAVSPENSECEERREEVETVVREPIGKLSLSGQYLLYSHHLCSDLCPEECLAVPLQPHHSLPAHPHSGITLSSQSDGEVSPHQLYAFYLHTEEVSCSPTSILSLDNGDGEGLWWELQQEMPDQFQFCSSEQDCQSLLQTGQEKVWRWRTKNLRQDPGDSLHLQIWWEV